MLNLKPIVVRSYGFLYATFKRKKMKTDTGCGKLTQENNEAKHFTFSWRSSDGLLLFGQGWKPEDRPKAVICLIHGLGEYSGRYSHLAAPFTEAGYSLVSFDLRGHGRSAGRRGHADAFDILLGDINSLLCEAKRRFPNRPRFLYGHSLGGTLALCYALNEKHKLSGVIASSPFFVPSVRVSVWKEIIGRALSCFLPSFLLSSELDPSSLSSDKAVVDAYLNDPLVHNRVSAILGASILENGKYILKSAEKFLLPLLVMHGSEDKIASFPASKGFAECVSSNCTFKPWDGMYHELHNEPQKQVVFDYVTAWLDERAEG